jgi:isopenicillin-N epimerase
LGTASQNVAFVTNATTGLNVISRCIHLKPGDEILASDHEYGALDRTWQFLGKDQGSKYINHPVPLPVSTTDHFVDQFWSGVTGRTRVIFLSHITSPTALIFPIKEIIDRARENNIFTVIDGAHAPGQIDLDLDQTGADFYTGNLHKWLCAPKGAGFVYVRPELHHMIQPLVVSWGWNNDKPSQNSLVDYIEWQGTRDPSAFLAVPDAIRFFNEHNWANVRSACHELLVKTIKDITRLTGLAPLSPIEGSWFSQMASVPLPPEVDCASLRQKLYQDYHIEIPVVEWNGRKLIRISIQAYNTREETEILVNALRFLIQN